VLAALLATPVPAQAHTELRESTPADSARLSTVPSQIRLRFSGAVELAFTTLELIDPDGRPIPLDQPLHPGDSAAVILARVGRLVAPGTYTVRWRTAAADGHPLTGSFSFVIEPGAAGLQQPEVAPQTEPGPAEPLRAATLEPMSDFDAESPLYVAVRWLTFMGLLGLIGAVTFRVVVLGLLGRQGTGIAGFTASADGGAARLGMFSAGILAVATFLRLYAQSYAFTGGPGAMDPGRIAALLTGTTWGVGWLVQLSALAVAFTGLLLHRRRPAPGWGLALLGAVALGFTPALSGHAASVPDATVVAVLADGLHVLGAGGWLGSLFATVAVGLPVALRLPDRRGEAVAALINAFSPTALAFAAVVVATGVFSAWLHVGSFGTLWSSEYGRTLLLKLGVLTVVFGTGAYNWLRVKPRLGHVKAAHHLRRSAVVELTAGVIVLIVTAILVATPTPMDAGMPATAGAAAVTEAS
jgi:putative copper export protein/methionine-rich copper-binding protein CopC